MKSSLDELKNRISEFKISEYPQYRKSEEKFSDFLDKAREARKTFKDEDLDQFRPSFKTE